MKKFLSLILALTMMISCAVMIFGGNMLISSAPDETASTYYDAVKMLVSYNIMHGKGDGKLGVYDNIKRYEMALFIGRILTGWTNDVLFGEWIREAGSTPVMYMTWAKKGHPEQQAELTNAYTSCAKEINALLAPVGVEWWKLLAENPSLELYRPDGEHASADGSRLAATIIWQTIKGLTERSYIPLHYQTLFLFLAVAVGLSGEKAKAPLRRWRSDNAHAAKNGLIP